MATLVAACVAVSLCACDDAAPERPRDNLLVLELGGEHEPLREALRRAQAPAPQNRGVQPREASARRGAPSSQRELMPPLPLPSETLDPAAADPAGADPAAGRPASAGFGRPPEPGPQPEPPAEAERIVELGEGQTVSALAREHLGKESRWREILELNGWTEEQAMRLQPGTRVRLPRR